MILPARAPVRPQVFIAEADVPVYLDDEVRERVESGAVALVRLTGPPGSGKSTAIAHLAFVLGDDPHLLLADCPDALVTDGLVRAAHERLVVFAAAGGASVPTAAERWRIAPWTQDVWIEYLLAAHCDRCGAVMRRVLADPDRRAIGGHPELWRASLDCLAADESLADVKTALRSAVTARLPMSSTRAAARQHCFHAACNLAAAAGDLAADPFIQAEAFSLLRHSFVQTLFAAEHLAFALESDQVGPLLEWRLPESLMNETAALVAINKAVLARLHKIIDGSNRAAQPMAASLLHAVEPGWIPRPGRAPLMAGAYLANSRWRGVRLKQLDVSRADLTECNLADSWIEGFTADNAELSGATLHGAQVDNFRAEKAKFIEADLSHIRAPKAHFPAADLRRANLEGALLKDAAFRAADLRDARVCRADLSGVDLTAAQLEGADFSGADLSSANLTGLTLRGVDFSGVQFGRAILCNCDMEGVTLPGARMERANLRGAYLTGSRMPAACFRGANLSGAGLADIEWERADLRRADLRGSTFHLGSSRSGLVGSPLACEGSRTGFYTDELYEQDFKSPEEIRKANLRGADLRGARIVNVDFYLVDVRDALYTPDQAAHLRQTGAILQTKV